MREQRVGKRREGEGCGAGRLGGEEGGRESEGVFECVESVLRGRCGCGAHSTQHTHSTQHAA
eukprot:650103-Rhodomonas_salina.1